MILQWYRAKPGIKTGLKVSVGYLFNLHINFCKLNWKLARTFFIQKFYYSLLSFYSILWLFSSLFVYPKVSFTISHRGNYFLQDTYYLINVSNYEKVFSCTKFYFLWSTIEIGLDSPIDIEKKFLVKWKKKYVTKPTPPINSFYLKNK